MTIRLTFDRDGMVYAIVDSRPTSRFIKRRQPDGSEKEVPLDYHVASIRLATAEEINAWREGK